MADDERLVIGLNSRALAANDAALARLRASAPRSAVLCDGDVIRIASGAARAMGVGQGGEEGGELDYERLRLACASAPVAKSGAKARFAFVARDDAFGANTNGMYATVHRDAPVIRFESKAMTAAAHWELASAKRLSARGTTKIVLRSCVRRDVLMEGEIEREYSPMEAFETWAAFVGVVEAEGEVQRECETEANATLEKLSAGFARELNRIEQQINAASRAKLGPRIVEGVREQSPAALSPAEKSVVVREKNSSFQSIVEPSRADTASAPTLNPLPNLQRRSTQVKPSTPLDESWQAQNPTKPRNKREALVLSDEDFPSPSAREIDAVRDEAWRFQSTGKKATKSSTPTFGTPMSGAATPTTPGMSSRWEFGTPNSAGSARTDESFFSDAGGLDTPPGARTNVKFAAMVSSFEEKNALLGKRSQLTEDDYELAAVRKSGIDPKSIISTPGGTSAMLKYVGRMYVSQFRSEMNILNVPYITLDEVTMDFLDLVAAKKSAGFKSKKVSMTAISDSYIAAMSVNNYLELLSEFGDTDGYAEISTLKRALAIAITTKGAIADIEYESESEIEY